MVDSKISNNTKQQNPIVPSEILKEVVILICNDDVKIAQEVQKIITKDSSVTYIQAGFEAEGERFHFPYENATVDPEANIIIVGYGNKMEIGNLGKGRLTASGVRDQIIIPLWQQKGWGGSNIALSVWGEVNSNGKGFPAELTRLLSDWRKEHAHGDVKKRAGQLKRVYWGSFRSPLV